jgi:hypothetical protein
MGTCRQEAENGVNHFIDEQKKSDNAFVGVASNVNRMRVAAASGQTVNCFYTDDERSKMSD